MPLGAETLPAFREEAEEEGRAVWGLEEELLPLGMGHRVCLHLLKPGDESRAHMAAFDFLLPGPSQLQPGQAQSSLLHPREQKKPQAKGASPMGGLECKHRKHPPSWGIYPPIDRPTRGKSDSFLERMGQV